MRRRDVLGVVFHLTCLIQIMCPSSSSEGNFNTQEKLSLPSAVQCTLFPGKPEGSCRSPETSRALHGPRNKSRGEAQWAVLYSVWSRSSLETSLCVSATVGWIATGYSSLQEVVECDPGKRPEKCESLDPCEDDAGFIPHSRRNTICTTNLVT